MSFNEKVIQITDEWVMHQSTIGEGAYGEVKLLVNRNSNDKLACKILNYRNDPHAIAAINKEVTIHRLLRHENIIKFYGRNGDSETEYIYLEFAAKGELFQMIEPDVGMKSSLAQRCMKQLLAGVKYLHGKGIVHRDIKPENLLVNDKGVLKISDFGLATLYRCKGKERLLDKRCGTKPYCAPEVIRKPYRGPPADIWSCGIVFIAMLTGELPWGDTMSTDFEHYTNETYLTYSPWNKLGNTTLNLIIKILAIEPQKRLTIDQILSHPWMKFDFEDNSITEIDGNIKMPPERWNSMMEAETRCHRENPDVTLSQPLPKRPTLIEQLINRAPNREICFSQPSHNEDLMICSQIQFTQTPVTKNNFNVIKRMTRIFVVTNYEKTLEIFSSILDTSYYTWHSDASGAIIISTVDCNKNQLIFKANLLEMDGRILIDFRLSKGCGIEFKKKFIKLKECLDNIIDKNYH